MPIYELQCPECGVSEERLCKVDDRDTQACQACGDIILVQVLTGMYTIHMTGCYAERATGKKLN